MKRSPHAIEDWCKNVDHAEKREMTEGEYGIYLACFMQENRMNKDPELMKLLESKDNYASVLWERIKSTQTVEVSPVACLFLGYHITNFGISTMVANYLQYVAHKNHIKKLGLADVRCKVFADGFPTEETWRKLWDMQKADDGGNILDDAACGLSIRCLG